MVAKAFNKPLYVAVESYKFARFYPLNQSDLPETKAEQRDWLPCAPGVELPPSVGTENPASDYTPASFITLLFTDLGILTPAAVSDELIRLYQ
jgi:translation initiation factor eIF-2B subunit alpha